MATRASRRRAKTTPTRRGEKSRDQVKRLKDLKTENTGLRRAIADLTLGKQTAVPATLRFRRSWWSTVTRTWRVLRERQSRGEVPAGDIITVKRVR